MFEASWRHDGGRFLQQGFKTHEEASAFSQAANAKGGTYNHSIRCYQATPAMVGLGATAYYYSDRKAFTVVGVSKSGKSVEVKPDKAIRTDNNGMSDSQSYRYEGQPDAPTQTFTLRKNGRWVQKGEPANNGTGLSIGYRSAYHDYSF